MLAATINTGDPLFWALLIGWILSVVLHEFAHGLVAYLGGDYTIRERGGLTLNPLHYVDPVMSLLLPFVFLLMGGVPLPGGATYVRNDLLRNRLWQSAVSLAGPTANLLLFFALAAALNPRVGWVPRFGDVSDWTPAQRLVGAMAFLQLLCVILNLVPIPPLDGFGAIAPWLGRETREVLTRRGVSLTLFVLFFILLCTSGFLRQAMDLATPITSFMGLDMYNLRLATVSVLYRGA